VVKRRRCCFVGEEKAAQRDHGGGKCRGAMEALDFQWERNGGGF